MGTYCMNARTTHEYLVRDFWYDLGIRYTYPKDFKTFLQKFPDISEENKHEIHNHIYSKYLVYFNNERISNKLFQEAFIKYREDFFYYLLALILLCRADSDGAYDLYKYIIKKYKFMKMKGDYCDKKDLEKILSIYINLISQFSISALVDLHSDNSQKMEFADFLHKAYNKESQELLIKNRLLTHIQSETVPMEKFFTKDYYYFAMDDHMREILLKLSK